MVVDDEYDVTFTLQTGLEDGSFDVDAFTDPELALLVLNWHISLGDS